MDLELAIRAYMLSPGPLATLVGTRCYPSVLPQGVGYPAMTYQRISTIQGATLDGPDSNESARIQFDCYSKDKTQIHAVAKALRVALSGFRAWIGGSPPTVNVHGTFKENEQDFYEPDEKLYRRSLDFILYFEES